MAAITITIENRPICSVEGCPNVAARNKNTFRKVCNRHHNGRARGGSRSTRQTTRVTNYRPKDHELTHCERCPFIPEHVCQLEVHHIDGDHSNNDKTNLIHLCANCHKLEQHYKRFNPEAHAEMTLAFIATKRRSI